MSLSKEEMARYSRHVLLPEIGVDGQMKLKRGRVLIIGMGGLGCPVGLYLTAAGVGSIGLIEFDTVETSNLQRQILYRDQDQGKPKLALAAERLRALNPQVQIDVHAVRFSAANAMGLVSGYDVVIDGTDNFPTRYLANDACSLTKRPYVYGSIFRFEGQASVFSVAGGPCFRCLFSTPPEAGQVPSCAEGGVLGVLPGLIGMIQATEAIKILTGVGLSLSGRLLTYDALDMRFQEFHIKRNPLCPVCGDQPTITTLQSFEPSCEIPNAGANAQSMEITPAELKELMRRPDQLRLIDVRTLSERAICRIETSSHIPIDELPRRLSEIGEKGSVVFYCKSGARSRRAVDIAAGQGRADAKSLRGGILAWIRDVDPSLVEY